VNGITVRTHGRAELRRVIVEAMEDQAAGRPHIGIARCGVAGGGPAELGPARLDLFARGEILGRWGDEQLLARLYDGRPLELPAPEELDDEWEVGDHLMVFFVNEAVVGWYLPDKQLGIDFSDLGATT
jgi:hypothetical protein